MKHLLLGDEAIAQGAIDAGLSGVYAYPGTPSTEVTEDIQNEEKRKRGKEEGGKEEERKRGKEEGGKEEKRKEENRYSASGRLTRRRRWKLRSV